MKDRRRNERNSYTPSLGDLEIRRMMASDVPLSADLSVAAQVVLPRPAPLRSEIREAAAVRIELRENALGRVQPSNTAFVLRGLVGNPSGFGSYSNVVSISPGSPTAIDNSLSIEFGMPNGMGSVEWANPGASSGANDSFFDTSQIGGPFGKESGAGSTWGAHDFFVFELGGRLAAHPTVLKFGWIDRFGPFDKNQQTPPPFSVVPEKGPDDSRSVGADDTITPASAAVATDISAANDDLVPAQSPGPYDAGPGATPSYEVSMNDSRRGWAFARESASTIIRDRAVASRADVDGLVDLRLEDCTIPANATATETPAEADAWASAAEAFGIGMSVPEALQAEPIDETAAENASVLGAAVDRILAEYSEASVENTEEASISRALGLAAGAAIVVEAIRRRRKADSGRKAWGPEGDEEPTFALDLRDSRIG
jgi:hypothetical protein